jgi:hypothetical protein
LLLRLHFYAGIFVGPFILIAAITGLLYAVIPQVDTMVFRHELTVDHVGELRLPLTEQLNAARAAHPEGTVERIRPPAAADDTTRVILAVDDVPPDYARTVFVDPYTGEVRGALTTYGQWMPMRAWFDELHRTASPRAARSGQEGPTQNIVMAWRSWRLGRDRLARTFSYRHHLVPLRRRVGQGDPGAAQHDGPDCRYRAERTPAWRNGSAGQRRRRLARRGHRPPNRAADGAVRTDVDVTARRPWAGLGGLRKQA